MEDNIYINTYQKDSKKQISAKNSQRYNYINEGTEYFKSLVRSLVTIEDRRQLADVLGHFLIFLFYPFSPHFTKLSLINLYSSHATTLLT